MRKTLVMALAVAAITASAAAWAQAAAVKPTVISINVVNGRAIGGIKRPSVKKGITVRIVVTTNAGKEIHLHGYNIEKMPRKGVPTVIHFLPSCRGDSSSSCTAPTRCSHS